MSQMIFNGGVSCTGPLSINTITDKALRFNAGLALAAWDIDESLATDLLYI